MWRSAPTARSRWRDYPVGRFPVTNAVQSGYFRPAGLFRDAVHSGGDALVFSTYLGGWDWDWRERRVAVGDDGSVVAPGIQVSPNYPVYRLSSPRDPGIITTVGFPCWFPVAVRSSIRPIWAAAVEFGYRVVLDAGGNAILIGRTGSPPTSRRRMRFRRPAAEVRMGS